MSQETDTSSPTRRVAKRDSLLLLTDLHLEDGRELGPARVRNLSATGLMAESSAPLSQGDRVSLSLRGAGDIAATVCWVEQGRIGIAFDTAIDPQAVRRPVGTGKVTEVPPIFPGRGLHRKP